MKEQIEQFLNYMTSDKKASGNTIAAYRNDLIQFVQFLCEPRLTGEAIPNAWKDVKATLILRYETHIKAQQYAVTTMARKIASVRSFLEYLQSTGQMFEQLGSYLVAPKVERTNRRAMQQVDIDKLLTAPTKDGTPTSLRDQAMLELLANTGMRIGELVSLDVSDVDLANQAVRCAVGKRRSRLVAIDQKTNAILAKYLQEGRNYLLFDPDEASLFLNHRGQRLTRQGLWLIIKQYAQENGLNSTMTPYTLRNSFFANIAQSATAQDLFHRTGQRDLVAPRSLPFDTLGPRHELIIDGKVVTLS